MYLRNRSSAFIIAEAGVNHNGKLELAYALIDATKDAGADAVKFQVFNTELCLCEGVEMVEYQKRHMGYAMSQFEMAKTLELSHEQFTLLKAYADKVGIAFIATAEENEGLDYLSKLEIPYIKVGSADVTNTPFLRRVGSCGVPVILSTGMSNLAEVSHALRDLGEGNGREVAILHCVTEYPAPVSEINLNAIKTMEREYDIPVGYSDHTLGIEASVAAVTLGAAIIEKHITLDCTMDGPDHMASLDPGEFKVLVKAVRNIESAMGDGVKQVAPCERKNVATIRKNIVAARQIAAGELLGEHNLAVKRVGRGIDPRAWDMVLGKYATKDFCKDEIIEL